MNGKKNLLRSAAAAPHIVWTIMFIAAPLLFVIYYAFTDSNGSFTLDNIMSLGNYSETFLLSVCFAMIATVICLLVAYPLAYAISRTGERTQRVLVMLAMLPMWMNLLIRTYSMLAILDDGGIINRLLTSIGMSELHIIGTPGAVIFGMVYNFFPYMLLPIYTTMSKMDIRLIEAAQDLGCNSFGVLRHVILPLSASGVISGITMVFVPSISTFYISQKLGGGTFDLIGDTIERQFQRPDTYNVGAAISLVMMVLILISIAIMNRFAGDDDSTGGIMV
ncbi:MAG: ABC transporter permease [Eubacteriales bacterium]|nr:ABC transporter permease [Clostridiales bacterium]MDD7594751.1 ABC transporter permease [Clostridiales bacterium]MDY4887038.1 ABC transporter permease [Eubacteriales bacterium]MDY5860826.1 ABC transporter permease [Eubacteriales bacterium]HCG67981.1 ABC transporter permease [Clostridiales bacterium]